MRTVRYGDDGTILPTEGEIIRVIGIPAYGEVYLMAVLGPTDCTNCCLNHTRCSKYPLSCMCCHFKRVIPEDLI